jgi:4,5-DOPA dioxygenase extradiol
MTRDNFNKLLKSLSLKEKMPVLFIGHGSPMNAIEINQFTEGWRSTSATLPKPKVVLCISAHWETAGTYVTAVDRPRTIHDFGGFPPQLYEVQYPAPGSPEMAVETTKSFQSSAVGLDHKWGLDHGCWSVLKHMYPAADIPVFQLSLDFRKPPEYHYEFAKELGLLRSKGVLILGSGNIVHNLGLVAWDKMNEPEYGYDWAIEANEKMKGHILSGDHKSLIDYKAQGRSFSLAVPTPEHFLPLLYILALKNENESVTIFNDKAVMGSLTMTSVKIWSI